MEVFIFSSFVSRLLAVAGGGWMYLDIPTYMGGFERYLGLDDDDDDVRNY